MPANSEFFGARDAKAVLKHGLLARYAVYFAGRAGSATGGKVAFIDGYAGEGRYDDGNPGSPLLLANRAKRAATFQRDVRLALVEQDAARRTKLQTTLDQAGVTADALLDRDLDEEIDGLLERYAGHAVLLFVDPFGLAISRSTLERVLRRRTNSQPIDVIYHFSLSSARRQGPLGVTDKYGAEHSAAQMDAALGSDTWREVFTGAPTEPGAATAGALEVARRFSTSVAVATQMRSTSVEVRKRPHHQPEYLLTLFSNDARAHWDFADMAGKAHVDWLHHCDLEEFNANLKADQEAGLLQLFEPSEPDVGEIDRLLKAAASEYLDERVKEILRTRSQVCPVDDFVDLYGEMLGRARAMHLGASFRRLHDLGLTDDDAKGAKWFTRPIHWAGT